MGTLTKTRKKARNAVAYWRLKDPMKYAKWLCITRKANQFMSKCDEILCKGSKVIDVDEIVNVDSDNEKYSLDGTLQKDVTTVDGTSKKVNSVLVPGKKATPAKRKKRNIKSSEKKPEKKCMYKTYTMYLKGGRDGKGKKLDNQGFEWNNGKVLCKVCIQCIKQPRCMSEHSDTQKHIENLRKCKAVDGKSLLCQSTTKIDATKKCGSISNEAKEYRCQAMLAAAHANTTITEIIDLDKQWVQSYSNRKLGGRNDLVNMCAKPVLDTIIERLRFIISGDSSFDEYSITFDGTPSFAEAEAITLRFVTKEYHVVELLVKCSLFEEKLNGEKLGNHVVDTIVNRLGLELKKWLACQQDRASTNKGCLRLICENFRDANPVCNYCCSHGLSNTGIRVVGKKGIAQHAESFRKQWQVIINHPGKARDKFKDVFGESVLTAGGVRFFVKFEQMCQLAKHGLENVVHDVVSWCVENKISEVSSQKLYDTFNTDTNGAAKLGMAIVEMAAIADGLKILCEACYTLEGDAQLILRAKSVFDRVRDKFVIEQEIQPRLTTAVDKALPMVRGVEEIFSNNLAAVRTQLAQIKESVTEMYAYVRELEDKRDSLRTGGVSRAGRQRRNTDIVTNMDQLEECTIEIGNVKSNLRELQRTETAIKKKVIEHQKLYDEWKIEFPYRTHDSLTDWGRQLMIPAKEYYTSLFTDPEGDCSNTVHMAEAAELFNPVMLSNISETEIVTKLHYLVDKLVYFKYAGYFTEGFIKRLKNELPDVVKEARRDHDLDRIKGNKQYYTRLQRRMKRHNIQNGDDMDWKEDAGEYARRIWEWWRIRVQQFPCHALAIRLVVLSQLSSCSVERVFSRLSLIRERCGENLYEDMTEIRLFMQCNGNLDDLYETALKFNIDN